MLAIAPIIRSACQQRFVEQGISCGRWSPEAEEYVPGMHIAHFADDEAPVHQI